MKNFRNGIIIILISYLFSYTIEETIIKFSNELLFQDLLNNKEFKFTAQYERSSGYNYLYLFPKNLENNLNSNKAILKIYFKEISEEESSDDLSLNYLNSDYSSIDFNVGLFIKLSNLKYNKGVVFVHSYQTMNLRLYYQYTKEIQFPSYYLYSNFQLNQFILGKGETQTINYRIKQEYNDYLLVLSKTSLRNIDVKVKYKNQDVTEEKLAYLYPNGCSVLLDKDVLDDNYLDVYVTIKNKNELDEILLLGYVHHRENEIFPNEVVNGFQIYLEGNKNEIGDLLITGNNNAKQFFNYQIYSKKLDIDFYEKSGDLKGTYTLNNYNDMFTYKINYEGKMIFQFYPTPKRNALYFQYIDYNEKEVAQKSLQSLVTGVPKSMTIPKGNSMYHFLPKERVSDNYFYYLRPKSQEKIYVSFKTCTSYPEGCYFSGKEENSIEIIQNLGLWYTHPRKKNELELIYIYCENDCSYDILMTYNDKEPLFLFPDNDYTKFISDSGEDMLALPVFEYLQNFKSIYIDLTIISGKADLILKNGRDGSVLNCDIKKSGNKQTCIITNEEFTSEKNNYFKKEIYAYIKQSNNFKNTFYNIMYGSGELNTKTLTNNIVYNELLTVPKTDNVNEYTKTFNFINNQQNSLYISISTELCQSIVTIDGTSKKAAYYHFDTLKTGSHTMKIYLINDGILCKENIEDKVAIFTYDNTQNILLSENTLINTTISSTSKSISFLHLFKPNKDEKFDNSFNIEIEKYDLNELTFTYQLKKLSFDENYESSDVSGQKLTSNKNRYISNNLIKKYCGELKENEMCGLTMTFTSSSSQFSLNLNKNSLYYSRKLTEKSYISSVNNRNPKYFYIDVDKSNNLELLINSYGRDLKFNYNIINKKQNDEIILPLKTDYNSVTQLKFPKNSFSSCNDFCRLYIGVTPENDNEEDISTQFFISYHYYDDDKYSENSIYIPFNYYIHYSFNDIKDINFYFFNTISNMQLTFDISVIKKKENDISTVTAVITGATNLEIKSDSSTPITISTTGQININIKPSDENDGISFKLRVSSIGALNIIPMVSSYAEKCSKKPCYYLIDDLSLDNEEKSAYFYIPESENSVINYLELKYDQSISITPKFTPSIGNVKNSNWYEYKIPVEDRSNILILKMETEETLYPSYYHHPNLVTLKYCERRMFTIKRGSKDSLKIRINRETSGNYKYIVKLHSIMGNGVFSTQNKNYNLGFENAFKQDIIIIFDNDKKYKMELEAVNKRFESVDLNNDFVFTVEYTIDSGKELKYPITFDKRNSFNFYKSVNFDELGFYLDRKEITSEDLNMNIKIYSSGNYDIIPYFADSQLNITKDKNELNGKIYTFIQGGGLTVAKLEISSEILKSNESPYIYIQINPQKNSGSNIVQIDLYPYNMINTNAIAADEVYTQKYPTNTLDFQLLFRKSEINYGSNAIINFIPPSDDYEYAIAQTDEGEKIIKKSEEGLVIESNRYEGFKERIINLDNNKLYKYLSFNLFLNEENKKSAPFIIIFQNHAANEEYLYNHDNDLTYKLGGKAKGLTFEVNLLKPKYSTSKNIFIIKAYKTEKVEKYSKIDDKYKSIYLLFNSEVKPDYTIYKDYSVNSNKETMKKFDDSQIKSGEYYFIGVSVILDNGKEQYVGYKGFSYKVESSSLWGEIADYMSEHIFASILIIIVILFILGIMVNICRAERKVARGTSMNINVDGKLLKDIN